MIKKQKLLPKKKAKFFPYYSHSKCLVGKKSHRECLDNIFKYFKKRFLGEEIKNDCIEKYDWLR